MDWYADFKGSFSYLEDFDGFNIPSSVLRPFKKGRFDPLSRKEKRFLALFKGFPEPFYIIGVSKPLDIPTVKHEIVHALFYLDRAYRTKVIQAISEHPPAAKFKKALKRMTYHKAVWVDETNAYAIANPDPLAEHGLRINRTKRIQQILRQLFIDHFGFSLVRMKREKTLKLVNRIYL